MKYKLSIATIFKNESHALSEWVEHYLYHGADHLYMVNDNSDDNFVEILSPYINNGFVTLYHNDIASKDVGRQILIGKKFFKDAMNSSEWIAVLDLDEFLYSQESLSIKDALKKHQDNSQVIVSWKHFGSNGHILQPPSIVEGFTRRATFESSLAHSVLGTKWIAKTAAIQDLHIHQARVYGKSVVDDTLWVNHYNLQSWDFYSNVKMKRGDVNNWFDSIGASRNLELFKKYDINEVTDTELYEQNKSIIKR